MIKLVCFLHRRPDVDRQAFHQHWRDIHGPLIAGLPELTRHVARYEQNPRLEEDYARDDARHPEFDGVTIMWFESIAAYEAYAAEPLYASRIAPDEESFLDRERLTVFLTHEAERKIGEFDSEARAQIKLLALLRRRLDWSEADFHAHWSGPHADLFREDPGLRKWILAYQQNHRLEEDPRDGPDDRWDGLAEQWYASLSDFTRVAEGNAFRNRVVPDEERFLDRDATRFLLCGPARVVL